MQHAQYEGQACFDVFEAVFLGGNHPVSEFKSNCMSTPLLIALAVAGIAVLLFLIIVVRLQAFLALLITSLLVAIAGGIPVSEVNQAIQDGMGSTLGYIAVVVGVGAMFGELLQVSGGAERVAVSLLKRFGQEKSQWALGLTGLIVSTPVFFDVALILFIPLVYSLAQRTGKSLLYYGVPADGRHGCRSCVYPAYARTRCCSFYFKCRSGLDYYPGCFGWNPCNHYRRHCIWQIYFRKAAYRSA